MAAWGRIMAGGWARDGAIQDQIDASVEDAVQRARSALPRGQSLRHCAECHGEIPEARREAVPGVRLCVGCQTELDGRQADLGTNAGVEATATGRDDFRHGHTMAGADRCREFLEILCRFVGARALR